MYWIPNCWNYKEKDKFSVKRNLLFKNQITDFSFLYIFVFWHNDNNIIMFVVTLHWNFRCTLHLHDHRGGWVSRPSRGQVARQCLWTPRQMCWSWGSSWGGTPRRRARPSWGTRTRRGRRPRRWGWSGSRGRPRHGWSAGWTGLQDCLASWN